MAKSLRSFPKSQRASVAQKRSASESGGLSFLAAKDYLKKAARGLLKDEKPTPVSPE